MEDTNLPPNVVKILFKDHKNIESRSLIKSCYVAYWYSKFNPINMMAWHPNPKTKYKNLIKKKLVTRICWLGLVASFFFFLNYTNKVLVYGCLVLL